MCLTIGLGQGSLDLADEIGAGFGVIACVAECGDRLRALPLRPENDAEVVMGMGVVGAGPDRLVQLGDPLLQLAL